MENLNKSQSVVSSDVGPCDIFITRFIELCTTQFCLRLIYSGSIDNLLFLDRFRGFFQNDVCSITRFHTYKDWNIFHKILLKILWKSMSAFYDWTILS